MATRSHASQTAIAIAAQAPTAIAVYDQPLAIATLDVELLKEVNAESGRHMTPLTLSKITVPSGDSLTFTVQMMDKRVPMEKLEGILIHTHDMRNRWGQSYDESRKNPEGGGPPLCSSWDGVTGVGDPGGTCAFCQHAAFGGDCTPGAGVYILLPNEILPRFLQVPQTSLGARNRYVDTAPWSPQDVRPLRSFMTIVGLEDRRSGNNMGKVLTFQRGPNLSSEDAALVKVYAQIFKDGLAMPARTPGRAVFADPTARRVDDPGPTTKNPLVDDDDDIPEPFFKE